MRRKELGPRDTDRIAEEIWHRVRAVDFETAAKMAERVVATLTAIRKDT
jgi:hypothetical protein